MNDIQIVRSARRSTIGIQILPDATVRVSVPSYLSDGAIQKILKEKADWITEQQTLMQARGQIKGANEYLYLGKSYQLERRMNQKKRYRNF